MGRFSASDARLHELRQPKPANAALRQDRPPQSHGSSLGPEHPQSAIRPARREGPTLDVGVIEPPPVPPAQRWQDPPRRPRGTTPASSPWDPTDRMPAQAPRGCCPGRAAARRTRNIPTEFRATSARRRQFGGDAGPRGPSRIRRSAPPLGHIGRQAEQGGLASAADRGNPGKGPAKAFAGAEDSCRQIAASMPHASGPTDRRPRPHLSKRPRKRPWGGQLRRRKCTTRNCGTREAPQERRRGCTRTPRRRHRSGWTRP